MISTKSLLRIAAVVICLVPGAALAQTSAQQPAKSGPAVKSTNDGANDKATYMTISLDAAEQIIAKAQEIGRLNGDTYYFIGSSMPDIGQIIRVKTTDHTKYMVVGTLIKGTVTIANPGEKRAFEQVENNITLGQARAIGLSGGSDARQPTVQNAGVQKDATPAAADGTVVKKDDGVIEVTLQGFVVDFHDNGDDIIITKVGGVKVGQLQFVAAMHGDAAQKAKSVGRVAGNLALSGITLGSQKMASVNPHSTAITTFLPGGQEYMVNSDNIEGKMSVPPFVGTAIAAEDLVRKQNPDFKIPNDSNLRQLVARIPTTATPPPNGSGK